ncbi:hypothetical protein [Paratractidigestivibacter sp.]|uniref:hypothetical protein n=1 Tax=Paratractidigestivibacter sp. TaxID=2847316 RepID=UPI002ABE6AEC|nr:hypothetical protein [Paratractidigestivibacter sp.]
MNAKNIQNNAQLSDAALDDVFGGSIGWTQIFNAAAASVPAMGEPQLAFPHFPHRPHDLIKPKK